MTGIRPDRRWPIGRGRGQGLNAGFLVIGDRHHTQMPAGLPWSVFIDDLDLLVDVQYVGHFDLEVWISLLDVVANLVRPEFALPQDLVEFGAAQLEQRRMSASDAVLAEVSEQQPVRPQFVRIAQFLRFLAGTILHPGNRVVWQSAWLTGSGQFSQRRVQTELEELLDTQHHRAAADMVVPGNGFITLAGSGIQEKRGPQGAPLLLGSRSADGLQPEQILLAELQGCALPREGHNPLKHKSR